MEAIGIKIVKEGTELALDCVKNEIYDLEDRLEYLKKYKATLEEELQAINALEEM